MITTSQANYWIKRTDGLLNRLIPDVKPEDLEDIRQNVLINLLKIVPDVFESDKHFYAWTKKFIKFRVINEIRNIAHYWNTKSNFHVGMEFWSDKESLAKYQATNNENECRAKAEEYLDELAGYDKAIIDDIIELGYRNCSVVAKKHNVTRRTIYNYKRIHFALIRGRI